MSKSTFTTPHVLRRGLWICVCLRDKHKTHTRAWYSLQYLQLIFNRKCYLRTLIFYTPFAEKKQMQTVCNSGDVSNTAYYTKSYVKQTVFVHIYASARCQVLAGFSTNSWQDRIQPCLVFILSSFILLATLRLSSKCKILYILYKLYHTRQSWQTQIFGWTIFSSFFKLCRIRRLYFVGRLINGLAD